LSLAAVGPQSIPHADTRAVFAGVPLDLVNMDNALRRIETALDGAGAFQVATVNLDFVVRAQTDPWLKAILRRTSMNIVDGMPLVWALRALGYPIQERVAGADLVPRLLQRMARSGHGVYLLGGSPTALAAASSRLRASLPGLRLVGADCPPVRPVEGLDPRIADRVRRAAPSLLLVGFGNPKQEYWLDLHLGELDVPVAIGVGGTIDLLGGRRRRAPSWMQRLGLEWVMRLIQEPVRLGPRYARDSWVLARLLPHELAARGGSHGPIR
jgi:N-acetylglucosaminyldiphosphoundecaprenol N-acetyl-beta-D-mannosaminyltransferase